MRLILDTHALIWFAEDDARLSPNARRALAHRANEAWCSVASIWELAIKVSLGKLELRTRLDSDFRRRLEESGFSILAVQHEHAARVSSLPWHHRDPFDRLLVAQALMENAALVSHDRQLDAYGIERIW